jgi:cellulose synthase/poly-beta-1,6-N-acetylglucosamine synthase-like glycosyltransferase
MWLLILIFLITSLIIAWLLFGYMMVVWVIGLFREPRTVGAPETLPLLSVVVPCFNEESRILGKLSNLTGQTYPADRLEIVFVDGGSTDRTVELLREATAGRAGCAVVASPRKGKINQLNHVLPRLLGELVVITDADAQLGTDTLARIAAEFCADPVTAVVGAYTYPSGAMLIERYYWETQNKGRLLETKAGSASIIVAPCYAFRRGLLSSFPEDVIADDVHVAFLANTLGYRTVYSLQAVACETRSPQALAEFMPHKFRKSNAFLRESLRFMYRLPEMNLFCKMMMVTRTAQQLLLPWAVLWWLLLAGVLVTLRRHDIVVIELACTLVLLVFTNRIFAAVGLPDRTDLPNPKPRGFSLFSLVYGYSLTLFIMLVSGICYPFYRQNSSYARIREGE